MLAGELLVHTKHIAHFAATHADVTCRHVFVGTDVAVEFEHESLAEPHHLGIALAAGREVAAAFAAAHRQGSERVLESLLKSKKLENRLVYR